MIWRTYDVSELIDLKFYVSNREVMFVIFEVLGKAMLQGGSVVDNWVTIWLALGELKPILSTKIGLTSGRDG